jgi:hypothetical protein
MKQKIGIELYKAGRFNEEILLAIANNNSGLSKLLPADISGFLNLHNARQPEIYKGKTVPGDSPYELHISEDNGETFTLSLTWKEIEELAPVDDIPGELYQSNGAN